MQRQSYTANPLVANRRVNSSLVLPRFPVLEFSHAGRNFSPYPFPRFGVSMAEESTYRYDIFISYSPADAEWALDWLLPRLTGAGLLVATPEESFRPGVPVLNETERCIRESRKIVAVLSRAYVADSAAEFEGLLVQHRDPTARLRRLIPIRLEAVDAPGRIALLGSVDMT
ncbi:MAG: toll/interleukin-1 receptor domain-containing protein, partial [Caldilineaceae bacterium]